MERGAETADEAVLVTGLSYVFYAGAFLAFYFLPLDRGTVSWSDLGWDAFAKAWPRISDSAEPLLAAPFLFAALCWGLGAKDARASLGGISRIGAVFVAAVALYLGLLRMPASGGRLSAWWWGLALWVLYWSWRSLSRVSDLLARRCGFGPGRRGVALAAIGFSGFEMLLFASAAHGLLVQRLGAARYAANTAAWPAAPYARKAGAADCTRAGALLAKVPGEQWVRLRGAGSGPWRDPSGEWATLLARDAAALAEARREAALAVCDYAGPAPRPGLPPNLAPSVQLSWLLALDARREESRGRASAAAADYAAVLGLARHAAQVATPDELYGAVIYSLALHRVWPPLSQFLERDLGSAADDRRLLDALESLSRARPDFDRLLTGWRRIAHARNRRTLEIASGLLRRGLRERALADYEAESGVWLEHFDAALREGPDLYAVPLAALEKREPWLLSGEEPVARCLSRPGRLGSCWAAGEAAAQGWYLKTDAEIRLARAEESVLAAGAALRLRQRTRGKVPVSLAMLTPELDAAPADPFADGASLRFLTAPDGAWTVYSVGPDRKDDRAQSVFAAGSVEDWRHPAGGDVVLRGSP